MKQSRPDDMDKKIKNTFMNKTEDIIADEEMLNKIKTKINENQNIGGYSMKKKIIAVSAACVLCLATVTCIASMKVETWSLHSSVADEINSFPDEKQLKEGAGFVPKYVENLSDKYSFKSLNFIDSEGSDSDGKTVIKTKEICFGYTDSSEDFNNGSKILSVYATNIPENMFNGYSDDSSGDISEYNGVELKYNVLKSVFLPPSYEEKDVTDILTEEEKQLKEEGKLNIAYGSSEIERRVHQTVRWYENGIGYEIMAIDCSLSREEMLDMAHRITDSPYGNN